MKKTTEYKYNFPNYINDYQIGGYSYTYKKDTLTISDFDETRKTAAIIGAGPAGLMSALVLARQGDIQQIYLFEKREEFNRLNLITIYADAFPFLKQVGILREIIANSCTIKQHTFYLNKKGKTKELNTRTVAAINYDEINVNQDYKDSINKYFSTEGALVISLADIQDILMHAIKKYTNVKYIPNTNVVIQATENVEKKYAVKVNKDFLLKADLIVIADGAHSKNARCAEIKYHYLPIPLPDKKETWYLFHAKTNVRETLLSYEFEFDEKNIKHVAYGVSNPAHLELGITLYCRDEPEANILFRRKAEVIAGYQSLNVEQMKWSSKKFEVVYSIADCFAKDNIILIGDAAGVGSPNSGMGVVLAISAYGWAIEKFIELSNTNKNVAIEFYNETCKGLVKRWHSRSYEIWQQIHDLIPAYPDAQT